MMQFKKKTALVSSAATALAVAAMLGSLAARADQTDESTVKKQDALRQLQVKPADIKKQPTINREALQKVRLQNANPPAFEQPTTETTKMALSSENVYDFLVWAATAPRSQKEEVRAEIARHSGDEKISAGIQKLYPEILKDDFDFALVALSVLGELKATNSVKFFAGVLNQSYPKDRVAADPGLTQRESIELLQTKAVQGLAYLGNSDAETLVLKAASSHPARAVRSAAVDAYLYNAKDPKEAREKLRDILKQDDLIFLDTISKGAMRSPEEFNKKLAEFYERHPDQKFEAPGEPNGPERADEPAAPTKDEASTPRPGKSEPR